MKNITDFERISKIIDDVRKNGDKALCKYILKFDGLKVKPSDIPVSRQDIRSSLKRVKPSVMEALRASADSIAKFCIKEKSHIDFRWEHIDDGKTIVQKTIPINCAAVYVPGGNFSYPSSVLMGAIPAKIAGVEKVFVITPPRKITPEVLAACFIAGVDEVYAAGGPAAIAAAAYGTKIIPKADKIIGPGNKFVAMAKSMVSGDVGIDMIAGPSEIVIIADETANPEFLRADLLAQLEHDANASAVLVTIKKKIAEDVLRSISPALKKRVVVKTVKNTIEAVRLANSIAPEHLEIVCRNSQAAVEKIVNAGAVFTGNYSCVALGDYIAGSSHVLPTNGSARFSSGLSINDFLKRINIIEYKKQKAAKDAELASLIADSEGMLEHKKSLDLRVK